MLGHKGHDGEPLRSRRIPEASRGVRCASVVNRCDLGFMMSSKNEKSLLVQAFLSPSLYNSRTYF